MTCRYRTCDSHGTRSTYSHRGVAVTPEPATRRTWPGSAAAGSAWWSGTARPGSTLHLVPRRFAPNSGRTFPVPPRRCKGPPRGTRSLPPAGFGHAWRRSGVAGCWSHCWAPVVAPCSPPASRRCMWTAGRVSGAPAAGVPPPGPGTGSCSPGWAWSSAAPPRSAQRWGSHAAGWPSGGSPAPRRAGPGCPRPASGSRSPRCGRSRDRRRRGCQRGSSSCAGRLLAGHLLNTPTPSAAFWQFGSLRLFPGTPLSSVQLGRKSPTRCSACSPGQRRSAPLEWNADCLRFINQKTRSRHLTNLVQTRVRKLKKNEGLNQFSNVQFT